MLPGVACSAGLKLDPDELNSFLPGPLRFADAFLTPILSESYVVSKHHLHQLIDTTIASSNVFSMIVLAGKHISEP